MAVLPRMNQADDFDNAPQRRWPVLGRSNECFGGGFRWSVYQGRSSGFMVAPSVPAAIIAMFLFSLWPSATSYGWIWMSGGLWALGWVIQFATAWIACFLFARMPTEWTLTLAGIWWVPSVDPAIPDDRPPSRIVSDYLVVWVLVMLALVAGAGWWMTLQQYRSSELERWWILPSMGVSAVDQPWAAAAWLWCLQTIWQCSPLPQSMGRVAWSGLFALLGGGRTGDPFLATRTMRLWMFSLAIGGMAGTILWMKSGTVHTSIAGGWMLLTLWLFVSAYALDLSALQRYWSGLGATGRWRRWDSPASWWRSLKLQRLERQRHRRLVDLITRERNEASDAEKADEVLRRLHEQGNASLTTEDRELLRRVSQAVRRNRQS